MQNASAVVDSSFKSKYRVKHLFLSAFLRINMLELSSARYFYRVPSPFSAISSVHFTAKTDSTAISKAAYSSPPTKAFLKDYLKTLLSNYSCCTNNPPVEVRSLIISVKPVSSTENINEWIGTDLLKAFIVRLL
jgi:hypothetical protein